MNAKITLTNGEVKETVIAREAAVEDDMVRVKGLDPAQCPDRFRENIRFFSKDMMAIFPADRDSPLAENISVETEIEVVKIEPTHEPVPETEPSF